ncbi:hypothetical protein A2767_00840 [Candidatus Roizmanbacteria bacterium RIFCSPHIGHO2_01_FULL_35_10]|uniref:Glycosyl transferase family 1 domain-containing protein n=1 Tax=Candidatus Roizmanbacteria bacterium RIFCSPLOWO2_01_FULL_35_13 TaxID=1802055 RepID=A0A1F7IDA3_9BACT|nr:MAG: hypothetical protein A2767_00840 [Candidatus Roizmanbacteria bacterium RIFCSPHIGHO2_01_FULL_35_10]OGK41349.1 MAG: hypothetical protein A3A74_03385 [Candidatus Roizmanbacteria bacterium RIFCSPLOWO2_01_FULL_35_13]
MRIGLLEPSILMSKKFEDRIFAPKELFINLADGLVKRGHEVYAYSASGLNTQAQVIEGNKILENNEFPSARDVRKEAEILSSLTTIRNHFEYEIELITKAFLHAKQNNLQILHSQSNVFTHYFTKFVDFPVLFTLHDPVFPTNTLEYFDLNMFSDHKYLSISNSQKEHYKKQMNINTVATIHHGLKIEDFTFNENSDDYLSMMGRYIPEKGFSDGILVSLRLKIPLRLASSQNYKAVEYYQREIKPYLNSGKITETNFLFPAEKNNFYCKSKLFLFPIRWEEPFGLVLIETMSCGTPVVGYARGSIPEIIKDGETGFIVNFSEEDKRGDWIIKKTGIDGLCEAVERIYSMPEAKYKQMRRNCRAHVEKKFTVERMVDDYEKVYRQIIENSKKK